MKQQWSCVVFHSSLPGGKASGRVRLGGGKVIATTFSGEEFSIPFGELGLDLGGMGDSLFFLKPAGQKEPLISTRDVHFLKALASTPIPPHVAEQIQRVFQRRRKRNLLLLSSGLAFVLVCTVLVLFLFQYGPDMAVQAVPPSIDEKLGEANFPAAIRQFGGKVCKHEVVNQAVHKMVQRLLEGVESPFRFEVRVLHSPVPNAFALPGGKIVVLTGILKNAKRPEEVAGVLAHEIGHVVRRHGVKLLVQRLGLVVLIGALIGDSSSLVQVLLESSGTLLNLAFNRAMERDADRYGFELLLRTRTDPRGLQDFFRTLQELQKSPLQLPSFLSTHPVTEERIQNLERWIREAGELDVIPFEIDWEKVRQCVKGECS